MPTIELEGVNVHVKGVFGQPVWEAIWRVIAAGDGCAVAFQAPVVVANQGVEQVCSDPQIDIQHLVAQAYRMAKTGPPKRENDENSWGLCKIDPDECAKVVGNPCPEFKGDLWNGVRQAEPESAPDEDSETDTFDKPKATEIGPESTPSKPSIVEVQRALAAVLPEAKRCLQSGDSSDRVVVIVTFGADGTVLHTHVGSSKTAESKCIDGEFRKARVPPFSDPWYVVSATLRR